MSQASHEEFNFSVAQKKCCQDTLGSLDWLFDLMNEVDSFNAPLPGPFIVDGEL